MAVVFPENMNKLDVNDTPGSLTKIESYIRYMQERVEFSMRNMTRTVSAAGVSSAELFILLTALQNSLSALTSTVQGIAGDLTAVKSQVTELNTSVDAVKRDLTSLNESVNTATTDINNLQDAVSALTARVAALENSSGGG